MAKPLGQTAKGRDMQVAVAYAQCWHDEFQSRGHTRWKNDEDGTWIGICKCAAYNAVKHFRERDIKFSNPCCYRVETLAVYLNNGTYRLPDPLEFWRNNKP